MTMTSQEMMGVQEQFETQLEIPTYNTTTKQIFLCPVGLIGSGKTTITKALSQKLGLVRISKDELRKTLKDNGFNYSHADEMYINILRKYSQLGYSLALDSDNINKTEDVKTLAKEVGAKIFWVHINPPEQTILKRLEKRDNPKWLFKDSEHAKDAYFKRKSFHKNITLPFIYIFGVSNKSIEEEIDEAAKIIKSNR